METEKKDTLTIKKTVFITVGSLLSLLLLAYAYFSFSGATLDSFSGASSALEMTKYEELHRYIGYEFLLPRYLTIPFDANIGINQYGHFLDIGYLILMFFPLFILYILRNNKVYAGLFIFVFGAYLFLSLSNSIAVDTLTRNRLDNFKKLERFIDSEPERSMDYAVAKIIYSVQTIYNYNVKPFLRTITGEQDLVTYPFMFILFLGLGLMTYLYVRRRGALLGHLGLLTVCYCFFWLMLSSGVIWYGYILYIFMMFFMVYGARYLKDKGTVASKFLHYGFFSLTTIWLIVGYACRVSNVNMSETYKHMGKTMLHSSVYKYNLGTLSNIDEVIEDMDKGQSIIFNRINAEKDKLVYKVGTSLMFFISENHRRVFRDDQLNSFQQLREKYKNDKELIDVLKASNFKFLLLDLQTFSIDKTPGQTLVKKYDAFREFVAQNPNLKFLGTDRVVKYVDKDGKESFVRHIYGDPVYLGTYAAFEIL